MKINRARQVLVVLLSMSAWACQRFEQDIDLSPATWPAGELEEFSKYDGAWGEPIPLAEGSRAMIAGTSSALAVRSGLEALKQGGSAVDAAMTGDWRKRFRRYCARMWRCEPVQA